MAVTVEGWEAVALVAAMVEGWELAERVADWAAARAVVAWEGSTAERVVPAAERVAERVEGLEAAEMAVAKGWAQWVEGEAGGAAMGAAGSPRSGWCSWS